MCRKHLNCKLCIHVLYVASSMLWKSDILCITGSTRNKYESFSEAAYKTKQQRQQLQQQTLHFSAPKTSCVGNRGHRSFGPFCRQLSGVSSLMPWGDRNVDLHASFTVRNSVFLISAFQVSPHWELRMQKLKSPGENTELKRSPFKAWSRSVYSHTCCAYCQGFLSCVFLPFRSIHLHFSKTFPNFFCVGCG